MMNNMLFNKAFEPLITVSEAVKKGTGEFDNEAGGHAYVVDKKVYPEITDKNTCYYKASDLGVEQEDLE